MNPSIHFRNAASVSTFLGNTMGRLMQFLVLRATSSDPRPGRERFIQNEHPVGRMAEMDV